MSPTQAVVVTTNLGLAEAPGNVFLPRVESGLPRDSVANVSQVVTADRRFFIEKVASLPADLLSEVDDGLRRALDLERER